MRLSDHPAIQEWLAIATAMNLNIRRTRIDTIMGWEIVQDALPCGIFKDVELSRIVFAGDRPISLTFREKDGRIIHMRFRIPPESGMTAKFEGPPMHFRIRECSRCESAAIFLKSYCYTPSTDQLACGTYEYPFPPSPIETPFDLRVEVRLAKFIAIHNELFGAFGLSESKAFTALRKRVSGTSPKNRSEP